MEATVVKEYTTEGGDTSKKCRMAVSLLNPATAVVGIWGVLIL